jgi:hypothetical protein
VLYRSLPNSSQLLAYTHQGVSVAAPQNQASRVPVLGIPKRNGDLRLTAWILMKQSVPLPRENAM